MRVSSLAAGSVLLAAPEADWIGWSGGRDLTGGKPGAYRWGFPRGDQPGAFSPDRRGESTDIGLEIIGADTLLRLSGGTLVAEVDPLRAHESFVLVLTTHYRVTVKGTIFLVRERTP